MPREQGNMGVAIGMAAPRPIQALQAGPREERVRSLHRTTKTRCEGRGVRGEGRRARHPGHARHSQPVAPPGAAPTWRSPGPPGLPLSRGEVWQAIRASTIQPANQPPPPPPKAQTTSTSHWLSWAAKSPCLRMRQRAAWWAAPLVCTRDRPGARTAGCCLPAVGCTHPHPTAHTSSIALPAAPGGRQTRLRPGLRGGKTHPTVRAAPSVRLLPMGGEGQPLLPKLLSFVLCMCVCVCGCGVPPPPPPPSPETHPSTPYCHPQERRSAPSRQHGRPSRRSGSARCRCWPTRPPPLAAMPVFWAPSAWPLQPPSTSPPTSAATTTFTQAWRLAAAPGWWPACAVRPGMEEGGGGESTLTLAFSLSLSPPLHTQKPDVSRQDSAPVLPLRLSRPWSS